MLGKLPAINDKKVKLTLAINDEKVKLTLAYMRCNLRLILYTLHIYGIFYNTFLYIYTLTFFMYFLVRIKLAYYI